ncbi:MAG: hypothetical protein ABEJ44_02465 [Halanaeroarchaeum sp.]
MTQTWVYVLVAIAIAHFLATVGLYYLSGRRGGGGEATADPSRAIAGVQNSTPRPSSPDEHDDVICSNCETSNEPGYRYCRQCVAPLGSASGSSPGDRGPNAPWIR